jgi:hypothetical protein
MCAKELVPRPGSAEVHHTLALLVSRIMSSARVIDQQRAAALRVDCPAAYKSVCVHSPHLQEKIEIEIDPTGRIVRLKGAPAKKITFRSGTDRNAKSPEFYGTLGARGMLKLMRKKGNSLNSPRRSGSMKRF